VAKNTRFNVPALLHRPLPLLVSSSIQLSALRINVPFEFSYSSVVPSKTSYADFESSLRAFPCTCAILMSSMACIVHIYILGSNEIQAAHWIESVGWRSKVIYRVFHSQSPIFHVVGVALVRSTRCHGAYLHTATPRIPVSA
jgi:membrane-associated HD superfamily phosphohydrolase